MLATAGVAAPSPSPDESCAASLLAPRRATALIAATLGYDIYVMESQVSGIPRTVVIMGECHVKCARDARLGQAVVDEFDHFGLETSAGLDRCLVGKAFLAWCRTQRRIWVAVGAHGSTIAYAKKRVLARAGSASWFDLEKEHIPTRREKIAVAALLARNSAKLARWTAYWGVTFYFIRAGVHHPSMGRIATGLACIFVGLPTVEAFVAWVADASGFEDLKNRFHEEGLLEARNGVMAKAILGQLREVPAQTELLVIVGRAHAWPIVEAMLFDGDFRPVPLRIDPLRL